MEEKGISNSFMFTSEEKIDSLYPMFFGVSCAFFALKLLPEPEVSDNKWLEVRNLILKGSVNLLGLLLWKVQKEESINDKSELLKEIKELKILRKEDAKANAKVASIIAAREQSWFDERKKLRHQICALMNGIRVLEIKNEKSVSELNEKLKENEGIFEVKDKTIEELEKKRMEIEEKLRKVENLHCNEISKHKTAFIELVSNQRQLEAELGRALRQVEATKHDLDSVFEQKEQFVLMNQRLSMEIVKMSNDLDQKDQILSALLRKSKLDTAEKQMLLKEVKSSKVKRKEAELETLKWKSVSETKHERHSLRNMLSKHVNTKSRAMMSLDAETDRIEFDQPEIQRGVEVFPIVPEESKLKTDVGHLENWVTSEAEKYKIAVEQRHDHEIDAFSEQLRLKDEKLEAYRWRLLSMELESKRLHSYIEGLNCDITQLKQDNTKLESLVLDHEAELHSLKEQLVLQFKPPNLQKLNFSPLQDPAVAQDTVWSNVKVIKRKPGQKRQESEKDIVLTLEYPNKEIKEGKVKHVSKKPDHLRQESIDFEVVSSGETSTIKKSNSTMKMDIHALGVSYKIKRLKQQLIMLERLTGKQESCEAKNEDESIGMKGFYTLTSLLDKQVERYQSLQGKIDDLCKRMHEDNLNLNCGGSNIAKTKDETKRLERFLEETFQLQRYIVATGQKLMEVQAKIATGFVSNVEEIENFDMKRFADSIRTLFTEVQRGLELRISRIIGDLGGTLACDGIIHLKM
ncbi:hypothetical protein ACJIZ3_003575 [Penstemon smallii]|uniref:Uncharacterized protein n=1 Tax=Penstemon smallii TaxID=265156 RepID=A0ABD3UD11_9LAMI